MVLKHTSQPKILSIMHPIFRMEEQLAMKYNLMPLKYFVDVVQTRGFISAAKRNYVSETAVSSAIKKLEIDLGQQLLNRSAGNLSLTPVGKVFYKRSVNILTSYNEIWHHPDFHPNQLLKIHFLQGLENETALLTQKLPNNYQVSFDEELFDNSINRLLNGDYDLLIGFQLAFINNTKIKLFPIKTISFDLIFNSLEVKKYHGNLQELAKNSMLYMQEWKSTGILDIQTTMLEIYQQDDWTYKQISGINSFASACLNVNFAGGFSLIPHNFSLPKNCDNIHKFSPKHLFNKFKVVAALNSNGSEELLSLISKVTT